MPRTVNSFDQRVLERMDGYSPLTSGSFAPNLALNNFTPSGDTMLTQPSDIVANGLVMYLDAAIGNSYPRAGTTWYDLSGQGNHGTLTNGPTFSSANGGVIVFDGTDDFVTASLNLSATSSTIFAIARWTGGANRRVISSNNNNYLLGWWSGTTDVYFVGRWVAGPGGGAANTAWACYAGTMNVSSGNAELFKNGVSIVGPNGGGGEGPNGIRLGGSGVVTEYSACQIGLCMAYNRVLSAAEIAQNFNATRGRFGL